MNPTKKIGPVLMCPIPFFIMLLTKYICSAAFLQFLTFSLGKDAGKTFFYDHYTEWLMVSQVILLMLFGIWYYLAYCRSKPFAGPSACLTRRSAGALFMLGLGLYCVFSFFVVIISILMPNLMAEYKTAIAETGLTDLTLLSTIATLILAPLSEELVFRGLILRYTHKATLSFHTANFFQALLFGMVHGNLIQGTYSFLLGLILGFVAYRLRTLYASILLHFAFNFFGTWFAVLLGYLPFPEPVTATFLLLAGVPLTLSCVRDLQPK